MTKYLLLLFSLIPYILEAQLTSDKTIFDHGNIEMFSNDTAYFTFTNNGQKNIYLLSTKPEEDYAILCSSKTVEPGESIVIGVVYYTSKKGKFEIKVPLFFSHQNQATQLIVKGNIKSIHETAFTKCPSIEDSKPLKPNQVPLSITVKDEQTQELLDKVDIKIKNRNIEYSCVPGLNSKTYKCKCDYGRLNIDVSKKGYLSNQTSFVFDPVNHVLTIELKKVNHLIDTLFAEDVKTDVIEDPYISPETKDMDSKDTTNSTLPYVYIPSSVADSGFNSYRYKPNHLIFIIDISGSMKDSTKLYYLKLSIKKLISTVRAQDHITLITYAYKVKVVFENYSGLDRTSIYKAIDTLSANGGSNGAQSMVMAYELARKYFITNGNNQIFLATDGLLNSSKISEEDLYKMARKGFGSDGIKLSSIGFGKDEKALEFLRKLAKNGRGNFLTITNTTNDLNVLTEEVKLQSLSK